GVSGLSVSQSQLDVMGQMVCVFNSSYILNSDPYVLEKLKLCSTLTAGQSSSVETVLLRGNTVYGAPASWNQTTLTSLGVLPLYLTSNFWSYFTKKEKVEFLRVFVPGMKQRGMSRQSISTLISQAGKASITRSSSLLRLRRDTDLYACTVGEITQVQASDASFPFGYDVNQFDACLSVQTLKDNLAAITDKATGSDFQTVILKKLNQAYPAGISDEVLQVRALVSMYVTGNRTLGYLELNALGGTNLCALDINLLKNIKSISLQLANPLSVSNCSLEKKQVLFSIAQSAFSEQTLNKSTRATSTISTNTYQLIQSYL
ncbi:mesothelin isoform X1, partial [Silurus meridionalis]